MSKFDYSDDDANALQWEKAPAATLEITSYTIEEINGEWCVKDEKGEIVGEWDTEDEAVDHARVLQESKDA